jgi:hypothetical protein
MEAVVPDIAKFLGFLASSTNPKPSIGADGDVVPNDHVLPDSTERSNAAVFADLKDDNRKCRAQCAS